MYNWLGSIDEARVDPANTCHCKMIMPALSPAVWAVSVGGDAGDPRVCLPVQGGVIRAVFIHSIGSVWLDTVGEV